ncbi:hypothetical protein ACO1O0_007752 [Amphichorda felina]
MTMSFTEEHLSMPPPPSGQCRFDELDKFTPNDYDASSDDELVEEHLGISRPPPSSQVYLASTSNDDAPSHEDKLMGEHRNVPLPPSSECHFVKYEELQFDDEDDDEPTEEHQSIPLPVIQIEDCIPDHRRRQQDALSGHHNDLSEERLNVPQPPPPASASSSHFAKFGNFTPDDGASFDDEFRRLASSQNWAPGSQAYTRERTIAMREEIKTHYFSQPSQQRGGGGGGGGGGGRQEAKGELTWREKLMGYQELCREVGLVPSESIDECKRLLKTKLVNIVDLIDARRLSREVKVWDDFGAFCNYTLEEGHMISAEEAKKDGGFLASLLRRIPGLRRKGGRRRVRMGEGVAPGSRVMTGRVGKSSRVVNHLPVV